MSRIVVLLHGIRTLASWQRGFADVASKRGWRCPLDGWWYGKFSILQFLTPFARSAKVGWFRRQYTDLLKEYQRVISPDGDRRPSVVAHSFGTYILGNALLKYNDIRFDKVILCGSILPRDFPWDELIERGQVNAVRNEIGLQDVWADSCGWIIPGTGAAGSRGFTRTHENLIQPQHNLQHSEFFDTAWMDANWMPFLERSFPIHQPTGPRSSAIAIPKGDHKWAPLLNSSLLLLGCLCMFALMLFLALNSAKAIWFPSVVRYELQDADRHEPIEREFKLTYFQNETRSIADGTSDGTCQVPGEASEITIENVECGGYTFDPASQKEAADGIILLQRDARAFRAVLQPKTPVDDPHVDKPAIPEYNAAVESQNTSEAVLTCHNRTDFHVNLVLYRWTPEAQPGDKTRWVFLAECKPGETRDFTVYDFKSGAYFFIYASVFGRQAQYIAQGNLHGPGKPELVLRLRDLQARMFEETEIETILEPSTESGDLK